MPVFTFQIVQLLQMYDTLHNIAQQTQVPCTGFFTLGCNWGLWEPLVNCSLGTGTNSSPRTREDNHLLKSANSFCTPEVLVTLM